MWHTCVTPKPWIAGCRCNYSEGRTVFAYVKDRRHRCCRVAKNMYSDKSMEAILQSLWVLFYLRWSLVNKNLSFKLNRLAPIWEWFGIVSHDSLTWASHHRHVYGCDIEGAVIRSVWVVTEVRVWWCGDVRSREEERKIKEKRLLLRWGEVGAVSLSAEKNDYAWNLAKQ